MKPLSEQGSLLLRKAYEHAEKDSASACEALVDIVQRGEVAAIPSLLSLVVMVEGLSHKVLAEPVPHVAATTICRLLELARPADLVSLHEQLRARSPYLSPWGSLGVTDAWKPEAPRARSPQLQASAAISFLERYEDARASLLALATFHGNGYVREEALRQLEALSRRQRDEGFLLPCLLLRANDWVTPLRRLAKGMLRERITLPEAPRLLHHIALVGRLEASGRGDPSAIVTAIHELLSSPEARPVLVRGLDHPLVEVRRHAWRVLAARAPCADLEPLLERVLRDPDPLLRRLAAERAGAEGHADRLRHYLDLLLRDPSGYIRALAVVRLGERLPVEALAHQEVALLDRDPRVRWASRYLVRHLLAHPEEGLSARVTDFRAFYAERAQSPRSPLDLERALLGLGDVGNPSDAPLGGRCLLHDDPRVRRAAVLLVGRLAGADYREDLVEALADPSPAVSKAARQVLAPLAPMLSGDRLWELFDPSQPLHVRRGALLILARIGKWASIRYLLSACTDEDPTLSRRATIEVDRWLRLFNRRQVAPGLHEKASLLATLRREQDRLPEELVRCLESILTTT